MAAGIGDIRSCLQPDILPAEGAAQVVDVIRQHLHALLRANRSTVGQVATERQLHIFTRQQCPAAVNVTGPDQTVYLRDQHLLHRAVRQLYGPGDHPDDIAGQLTHLLRRQGNAGRQVMFPAKVDAIVHQRFILIFVALLTGQIALPGQGDDLLAVQPLLVPAVAEPLMNVSRIGFKRLQHPVRAEPRLFADKAWVGFNQPGAVAFWSHMEQAAVRQAGIGAGSAYYAVHPLPGDLKNFAEGEVV